MTIGERVRAYLLGGTAIASLVDTRVYPLRLPQPKAGTPLVPAVVLSRISEVRGQHLRGIGGLTRSRYQVDAWAATHDGATALGHLCRERLDGFTGIWPDTGSPATDFRVTVLFESAMDLFEEEIAGGLCRHSADYFVWHGAAMT